MRMTSFAGCAPRARSNRRGRALAVAVLLAAVTAPAATVSNLGLNGMGARARSWEPSAAAVAGYEASKANDGRLHTYWLARPETLPVDLGLEWALSRKVSSLIVRYLDGRMVRGPAVARHQEWARLQYWDGADWADINAQLIGQETSSVRYVFAPVTTSRIRVLFTEPPDPEARRQPEPLAIAVSEIKAFSDVPFQWITSPGRIGRSNRRGHYKTSYNEPPSGDCGYDLIGPLVIEPHQTRIFTDTLRSTLIVADSRWAREPASVDRREPGAVRLRNGFLVLELDVRNGVREAKLTNAVTSETVETPRSQPFVLRLAGRELRAGDFRVSKIDESGAGPEASRLRLDLTSGAIDVSLHYELRRQDHFYHKWLTVANKSGAALELRDLIVSSLGMPRTLDLMAGQELTYPILRMQKGGFFSALETVYWDHMGDTLAYYPGTTIAPAASYESEKAVVGVYRNRGEMAAGFDHGVREWVTEYHAQVSPLPAAWPDVYCEAWSARFGVVDILERPEWSEKFMSVASRLGIKYMDMYEATHEAVAMPHDWLGRLTALGDRYGIGVGFWTDFGSDSDFARMGLNLKPHACKLSPEASKYFQDLVAATRNYKFRAMHWGDFLTVWQCYNTSHGHLPGKYSIHAQGQRLVKFAHELREASPGLMLGADGGFTNPQYVRHEDSRAHGIFYGGFTGDHWPSVEPDIHLDRLYANMNRVWVNGGYSIFLRPWFRMINGVNHFGHETQNHDRAWYRYALISALAMAGQVTFNDVPVNMPDSEIEFTRRWLDWARQNRDYLKQGDRLFDRSLHFADVWQGDAEALSGFSHIRGDRGYVFLINPSVIEQIAEFTLALDSAPGTAFVVEDIYPNGATLAGGLKQGATLRITVPAKQSRILWIAPGSADPSSAQPEDAAAGKWRDRYIRDWQIAERESDTVRVSATFVFPEGGKQFLEATAPPAAWQVEPWAYDKAYLVLLLKDETDELNSNWVPDKLHLSGSGAPPVGKGLSVAVNGVPKTVYAFKTKRVQPEGLARCYFVELRGEVKPDAGNKVEIALPIRRGLVFSGAYVDLPDQVPLGAH